MTPDLPLHPFLLATLLFAAGLAAGVLNVLAGGGSFLTLPLLIFAGLPAGMANATNRVGILLQNVAAVWSFKRALYSPLHPPEGTSGELLPGRTLLQTALPAVGGGLVGALLALTVSDALFQRLLAVLMVVFALLTFVMPSAPSAGRGEEGEGQAPDADTVTSSTVLSIGFFAAGVYAGFVQAGVGFFFLALTTAAGLDMVRGNALKVQAILCLTAVALGVFAWQGLVAWPLGAALGCGQLAGGLIGARLTVLKGHAWVRRVVLVMVAAFAVKLWLDL